MACKAIKFDNTLCKNWSISESEYCQVHQDITPAVHKERWFQRYILGNRPDHDRIFYFHFSEENSPSQPILEPLYSGEIHLTNEDVNRIPAEDPYLDVFLLLLEHGFATIYQNKKLTICLLKCYIRMQLFLRGLGIVNRLTKGTSPMCRVFERLLHKDTELLVKFIHLLPEILHKKFSEYEDAEHIFIPILSELLEVDAQRELSWYDKSGYLLEIYNKNEIGKKFLPFLQDMFYPRLRELFLEERKAKYARCNIFKEELMMVSCHPDRIHRYLEMGIAIEDLDKHF